MLETLNSDIDNRILKEVRMQTQDFRTYDPTNEQNGDNDTILERVVEKKEFFAELDKKASKINIQDCIDSLNLLHSQLKQMVVQILSNYKKYSESK